MKKPKILFYDIESLANQGFIWNLRDPVGSHMITKDEAIITIAYKWAGSAPKVLAAKRPYVDKEILAKFVKVWSEADYVVGHYSDKFDQKYIAYRLMVNGLPPLAPVAAIDTYKLARKHFKFNSNKLDFIGRMLGVGRKNPMGWSDWEACARGDKEAIQKMAEYNMQDVVLLEDVFNAMLPHCHSCVLNRLTAAGRSDIACRNCESTDLEMRGYLINKTTRKQRYQCRKCGSWGSKKLT